LLLLLLLLFWGADQRQHSAYHQGYTRPWTTGAVLVQQ
jgi:hypothetical protein